VQQTVTVGDIDCHSFFGGEILQSHASYDKKGKQTQLYTLLVSRHMGKIALQAAFKKRDGEEKTTSRETAQFLRSM
jgi:hypothetical protein